MLLPVISR